MSIIHLFSFQYIFKSDIVFVIIKWSMSNIDLLNVVVLDKSLNLEMVVKTIPLMKTAWDDFLIILENEVNQHLVNHKMSCCSYLVVLVVRVGI